MRRRASQAGAVTEEALVEPENVVENIELGATLPVHALRHLFRHSEVHLNVEWRDLTEAAWKASVRSLSGDLVPIETTPWLRAREIWIRALDLNNGGTILDFPAELRAEIDEKMGIQS
jgi:maleylpyruvate isomerase